MSQESPQQVLYLTWEDFLLAAEEATGLQANIVARVAKRNLAESALLAPAAGFGGIEIYPSFAAKVAVLLQRLASNHALPDGNKRTALLAAIFFANLNGYDWEPPEADDPNGDETVEVILAAATSPLPVPVLAAWVADRLIRVAPPLPKLVEDRPALVIYPPEFVGSLPYEDNSVRIGDMVIRNLHGYNPASVYVRRISGKTDGISVAEVVVSVVGDGHAQEELDAENEEATRYPLGVKEYWRGRMVGKYTYGADGHLMTNDEFEADWNDAEGDDAAIVPGTDATAAEIAAHETGPVDVAINWVHAILAMRNFEASWPLLDDNFRLTWAQSWLFANQSRLRDQDVDELASALSSPGCIRHPFWADLAEDGQSLADSLVDGWDDDKVGFFSSKRIANLNYEVVVLAQGEEVRPVDASKPTASLPFLMHFEDGLHWRIARIGADTVPIPGWPPIFPDGVEVRRFDT